MVVPQGKVDMSDEGKKKARLPGIKVIGFFLLGGGTKGCLVGSVPPSG